ncbi:hypothetical protein QTI66_36540 [Variovorax sp. J22R133]|uniref:hypothetical protein n=1 Tax=Variovorax brevis TaxID=3053503 RepID=UPI0025772964|nr:hypothetical protein [Variovorax sp. J22R133]MDM0117622.1 hypothetical protein [Variovorax sp. J22R133]
MNATPVEMQIQWALACFGMGEPDAAREHLLEGLRVGHSLGRVRSVLDVSSEVPHLMRVLLAREGLDPVLAFYVSRLHSAAGHSNASPTVKVAPSRYSSFFMVGFVTLVNAKRENGLGIAAQNATDGFSAMPVKWRLASKRAASCLRQSDAHNKWRLIAKC